MVKNDCSFLGLLTMYQIFSTRNGMRIKTCLCSILSVLMVGSFQILQNIKRGGLVLGRQMALLLGDVVCHINVVVCCVPAEHSLIIVFHSSTFFTLNNCSRYLVVSQEVNFDTIHPSHTLSLDRRVWRTGPIYNSHYPMSAQKYTRRTCNVHFDGSLRIRVCIFFTCQHWFSLVRAFTHKLSLLCWVLIDLSVQTMSVILIS